MAISYEHRGITKRFMTPNTTGTPNGPVGWWSWIAQAMPHDAEAGGGLMVAVIQFAIALGSTVGGVLFDASGYRSAFVASAIVLLIGAFLTFQTSRAQAR